MNRPQSSDLDLPQFSCLKDALSELSQPTATVSASSTLHLMVSSLQSPAIPEPDDGSASISLLQKPNCSNSTYRYFGETQDDVPHGFGIRIYLNSGSTEKGQFFHGVFQPLGEFTCADYGTRSPRCHAAALFVVDDLLQYIAVHFSGEWPMVLGLGSGCTFLLARIYRASF